MRTFFLTPSGASAKRDFVRSVARGGRPGDRTAEEEDEEARLRALDAETLDRDARYGDRVYDRVRDGDPVVFVLLALCAYVASSYGVHELRDYLPSAIACACTMVGSRVYYRRKLAKTAKRMQIAHNSALRWTPISPVETAGWINWTTTSMWEETLGPKLTEVIQLSVTRALRTAKFPWFIAGAAVTEVNLGSAAPKIGNFQVLRNRYGRQVCEGDVSLDGKEVSIVVRLNLRGFAEVITGKFRRLAGRGGDDVGGTSVDVKAGNLSVEGRIRYYPLLGHPVMLVSFATMPRVSFDVNVSGVSMTAMPKMKEFIGQIISEALGRKLIFPYGMALELGARSNVKAPETGVIEVEIKWVELWASVAGGDAEERREEEDGGDSGAPSPRRRDPADADASESDLDDLDLEEELSAEVFVGSKRERVEFARVANRRARLPGMPPVAGTFERPSASASVAVRFPVKANNSRIQLTLKYRGVEIQGVVMYKWCSRTCLTHAWYAAPIPDMKTDTMRLHNAESRRMIFGLHTQTSAEHRVEGACEAEVKFLWAEYNKWDFGTQQPGTAGTAAAPETERGEASPPVESSIPKKPKKAAGFLPSVPSPFGFGGAKNDDVAGVLQVDVVRGRNLPARDANGFSDPYVTLRLGREKSKTSIRSATLTPVWEHRAFFVVEKALLKKRGASGIFGPRRGKMSDANDEKGDSGSSGTGTGSRDSKVDDDDGRSALKLELKVFDHDAMSWRDEFLGVADVDVSALADGALHNRWVALRAVESGEILLRAKFFPGVDAPPSDKGWAVEPRIDAREALEIERRSWHVAGAHHVGSALTGGVAPRPGRVTIHLSRAENLVAADAMIGSSDPYVVLRCGSDRRQSAVRTRTLNPRWNETFEFGVNPIQRVAGRFLLELRDRDYFHADDFLGNATVEMAEVPDDGSWQTLSLDLEGVAHGVVTVRVKFTATGKAMDVQDYAAKTAATQGLQTNGESTRALAKVHSRGDRGRNRWLRACVPCGGAKARGGRGRGKRVGGEIRERVATEGERGLTRREENPGV